MGRVSRVTHVLPAHAGMIRTSASSLAATTVLPAHAGMIPVFGERGWAGFSVEAVAKRAGVGKASIHLR